jgi:hypothetical protein
MSPVMQPNMRPACPEPERPYERCRNWKAVVRGTIGARHLADYQFQIEIEVQADQLADLVGGTRQVLRELALLRGGAR